jgi:hypothetical protein
MSLADIAKEASEFSKKLLYELFGDDVDTGQAERKEGDPKNGNQKIEDGTAGDI